MARRTKHRPPQQKQSSQSSQKHHNGDPGVFGLMVSRIDSVAAVLSGYKKFYPLATALLLGGIILFGASLRLDDLKDWKQLESRSFFNKQPLHTTFDAWFYLTLARDLLHGTYTPVDQWRGVPDSPPRPSPPPLISVIAAIIAKATTFSLSWIGAILPVLLGPLIAVPLYFLGRSYGGVWVGLVAALCSVCYPFYIYRSNIGRFDTDCLNVTFALWITYLCQRFAIDKTRKRYAYCVCTALVSGLFLWWWDQTPAAVAAITMTPMAIALLFFYRPPRREALIFYGILTAGAAAGLAAVGIHAPLAVVQDIWEHFLYISKDETSLFPNIGLTISEQSRASLDMVVSYTTGNVLIFCFALAGIITLFYRHLKQGAFLIVFIILSVFTFTYANRFLIFMIPLLALGTGMMLSVLWHLGRRFYPLYGICPLLVILFLVPMYQQNRSYTQWPKEFAPTVAGMDIARQKTPQDAVVWAWWDHGYALNYYAQRATVNDGSIHNGERTVYTAIPLAADSYQLSANFICFYVIRGIKGLKEFYGAANNSPSAGLRLVKEILAAGPKEARAIIERAQLNPTNTCKTTEDWLRFFFPANRRPVYLFLDNLLTKITYWWYWFGTWDIESQEGQHPFYAPYYNIHIRNDGITGSDGLKIDTTTGEAFLEDRKIMLSYIGIRQRETLRPFSFGSSGRYRFEMVEQAGFGAIMDKDIAESVFNKLFIRLIFPDKYFRPIDIRMPHYQLWEVQGDIYDNQG